MNYYPLFRVRSWNKDMRSMSFYILMNLWYGRIALDTGWIMSWWYLPRIWPSVTDMQHYYHAGYPTDDWHLAYMFIPVYFSVEMCLEGVVPHSVSTRRHPCQGLCTPHAGSQSPSKSLCHRSFFWRRFVTYAIFWLTKFKKNTCIP